jgi:uncharacterized protein (DUF1330 family)
MMQQTTKLAITLLSGIAVGAGLISTLHAQAVKKPAFVLAEVEVTDPAGFAAYAAKVPDTLKPYNGRILVRGKPDVKEGALPHGTIVVIGFDSLADAEKWYSTPQYAALIPERQKAAKTRLSIVEGLSQ